MWRDEFSDDYAVPEVITAHPDLVDISWHNDASPSFEPRGMENFEDTRIRLWVQHPDTTQRELPAEVGRFLVYSDSDENPEDQQIYEGDDAEAAIAALLDAYATYRKANPITKMLAKEVTRLATIAAEKAAEDDAQRQHADKHPTGCPDRCGACIARVNYGLTIGSMIVLTTSNPWRGPERRGMEKITQRCRITHIRRDQFDYASLEVIDVADPLPGGGYDGDVWRTREQREMNGGMTWSYAFKQLQTLSMRIER